MQLCLLYASADLLEPRKRHQRKLQQKFHRFFFASEIKALIPFYKDNIKNAQSFLSELGNPYETVFLDIDGTISIEWGAIGVPETFLIHNKKIIKKVIGPINENTLIEIESLIK